MERTKLGLSKDKMYKALGDGERTSKKVSMIRKSDGSTFKRKNANQYGTAEGGNDYTEKRTNRTDRFDLGGTADSSNLGANMGGTMGSSVMKKGGNLIGKQKNLDLNKNGKLDSEDFKMIRGNKKANGGGLANVPESFPETDAMSYKTGGSTVKDNRMNERTRAVILKIQKTGIHPDDVSPNFVNEIAYDNGIELKSEEVVFISDNYGKKSMANGGSTKGFEYTIGGL